MPRKVRIAVIFGFCWAGRPRKLRIFYVLPRNLRIAAIFGHFGEGRLQGFLEKRKREKEGFSIFSRGFLVRRRAIDVSHVFIELRTRASQDEVN